MTDTDVIRRCLAGEPECFRVLVERYHRKVVGLAFNMTRDHHLSEDLCQDVCREAGRVYELESMKHGLNIIHTGFKVPAPSALDAFCARQIAGRHCDIRTIPLKIGVYSPVLDGNVPPGKVWGCT